MVFVLPCNITFLQLWLSDQDRAEVATCTRRAGAGQRRNKTGRSVLQYRNSHRTPLMLCLGTDYRTDAYSPVLWEKLNLFNSITATEIKNLLRLRDNPHLNQCTGGWSGGPQSSPQTSSLCINLNLLQIDCRGGLVAHIHPWDGCSFGS